MLTDMAREDIAYLGGLGVKLTPDQIVRLNDLARRAVRGPDAADLVAAPRVAWAAGTAFYEPTVQAEVWLTDYAAAWWRADSLALATAWACAHAPFAEAFAAMVTERHAARVIRAWRRSLRCTRRQMDIALEYALVGDTPADTCTPSDDGDTRGCPYTELINEAVAAQLGDPKTLSAYPRRIVDDMLRRWLRNEIASAGGKPDSVLGRHASRAYAAYADYVASLEPAAESEAANGEE